MQQSSLHQKSTQAFKREDVRLKMVTTVPANGQYNNMCMVNSGRLVNALATIKHNHDG